MVKEYKYDDKRYFSRFVLTGYFMIAAALYCAFKFITLVGSSQWAVVYLFFFASAVYGSANTLLLNANPKEIIFTDDSVSFTGYSKTHTYKISDLEYFRVKELPSNYQLFVRLGTKDGVKRRYWISYDKMESGGDIIAECHYIERKLNPSNIKFKGWDRGLARPDWGKNEGAENKG